MRIAYISYEHPLGVGGGGIGTYIGQVSRLMAERGHGVEVFAAAPGYNGFCVAENGCQINFVPVSGRRSFPEDVLSTFRSRHEINPFDLVESPEYGADAIAIKKEYPHLPLILKLHTPSFLTATLNAYKRRSVDKVRYVAGALLRLQRINPYWRYQKASDPEYSLYQMADAVSSPSNSLAGIVSRKWGQRQIDIIPYPFERKMLTDFQSTIKESPFIVTFIGRIERRKGVVDLIKAIPAIIKRYPDTVFRLVGEAVPSPRRGLMMDEYLQNIAGRHAHLLDFTGLLPHQAIPEIIRESHVCIFPSLWENFPNVCLEAMFAGKAVIGTGNGGMADMITDGFDGLLIPPGKPAAIARAVNRLGSDRLLLDRIGINARQTVLSKYNGATIGALNEDFYYKTLAACSR
jgi:glycogen(starch) synthase